MDADARVEARGQLRFLTILQRVHHKVDRSLPTSGDEPWLAYSEIQPDEEPNTIWDRKVALRRTAMLQRAELLFQKRLPARREAMTPGVMEALRRGSAVLDDNGVFRCPPGTPGAMQFTNFAGEGCEKPGGLRRARGIPLAELDKIPSGSIPRVTPLDIAQGRVARGVEQVNDPNKLEFMGFAPAYTSFPNALRELTSPGMGFTFSLAMGRNVEKGYAIARKGRGVRIRSDQMYDENGEVIREGATRLARMIAANERKFREAPQDAAHVALGGWHSDKAHLADGTPLNLKGKPAKMGEELMDYDEAVAKGLDVYLFMYFDVTDVYPESIGDKKAYKIGKQRNQQSVAKLSQIAAGNYDTSTFDDLKTNPAGGFIDTRGTGGDLLDEDLLQRVDSERLGVRTHG